MINALFIGEACSQSDAEVRSTMSQTSPSSSSYSAILKNTFKRGQLLSLPALGMPALDVVEEYLRFLGMRNSVCSPKS